MVQIFCRYIHSFIVTYMKTIKNVFHIFRVNYYKLVQKKKGRGNNHNISLHCWNTAEHFQQNVFWKIKNIFFAEETSREIYVYRHFSFIVLHVYCGTIICFFKIPSTFELYVCVFDAAIKHWINVRGEWTFQVWKTHGWMAKKHLHSSYAIGLNV